MLLLFRFSGIESISVMFKEQIRSMGSKDLGDVVRQGTDEPPGLLKLMYRKE